MSIVVIFVLIFITIKNLYKKKKKLYNLKMLLEEAKAHFYINNGFVVKNLFFTIIPYNVDILSLDSILND